jgi:lysophospholipase L1-like esterase
MIAPVIQRLSTGEMTRIVAFGSSNTERFMPFLNWFDWLDLCLRNRYGRIHVAINAGIGGDTSRGLLDRFDRFIVPCNPDVVFVTIGGNDSGMASGITDEEFAANLHRLVERIRNLPSPALPILQTYYSADLEIMVANEGQARADRFLAFMQDIRDVAAETGCPLIDHLARWECLRTSDLALYRSLILDPMHLNADGNQVMGLDAARHFGIASPPTDIPVPARVAAAQAVMDGRAD